ncbi:MAG TPA: DUF5615 family PIN-like protein [Bryobacteraceae bacterium]|nr:DUF5615 family PIN-like protein [Bryobacteraceae bacterium]
MKFLADENFPLLAIAGLRERGFDVTSIVETTRGISDEDVAAICARDQRVLLTFDKDFGELVFRRGVAGGCSIVLLRIEPDPVQVTALITSLVHREILKAGIFCVLTRDRVRVRPLQTDA